MKQLAHIVMAVLSLLKTVVQNVVKENQPRWIKKLRLKDQLLQNSKWMLNRLHNSEKMLNRKQFSKYLDPTGNYVYKW